MNQTSLFVPLTGSRGADVSPKGCGPSVTSDEISSFPSTLPDREGASFSLLEPQDQEDLEPVKKRVKAGQNLEVSCNLRAPAEPSDLHLLGPHRLPKPEDAVLG